MRIQSLPGFAVYIMAGATAGHHPVALREYKRTDSGDESFVISSTGAAFTIKIVLDDSVRVPKYGYLVSIRIDGIKFQSTQIGDGREFTLPLKEGIQWENSPPWAHAVGFSFQDLSLEGPRQLSTRTPLDFGMIEVVVWKTLRRDHRFQGERIRRLAEETLKQERIDLGIPSLEDAEQMIEDPVFDREAYKKEFKTHFVKMDILKDEKQLGKSGARKQTHEKKNMPKEKPKKQNYWYHGKKLGKFTFHYRDEATMKGLHLQNEHGEWLGGQPTTLRFIDEQGRPHLEID